MKRSISLVLAIFMLTTLMFSTSALAAPGNNTNGLGMSGLGISGDVNIGVSGGKSIELRGHIEPVIISVVMPSAIPFDISYSLQGDNKVVSPQIDVTNNSDVPVAIGVNNVDVDLTSLPGISWGNSGQVGSKQIAIGFYKGDAATQSLANALWLQRGPQAMDLMQLNTKQTSRMFIVGTLGNEVPENRVFTVTPTLVVKRA